VTFGEKVKALREEKGWSQAELARRAALNSQTIFRIEHGLVRGGWLSRTKLAKAFGIPIADLDTEKEATTHAEDASALTTIPSLTDQALLEILFAVIREVDLRRDRDAPPFDPTPERSPRRHPRRPR